MLLFSDMNYSLVDSLMEEFDQKSSMKIPEDIRARVNVQKLFCCSRSSRKRPPWEFRKVVAVRAGCLREWALVSDHGMKQYWVVAYESFYHKGNIILVVVMVLNSLLLPIPE